MRRQLGTRRPYFILYVRIVSKCVMIGPLLDDVHSHRFSPVQSESNCNPLTILGGVRVPDSDAIRGGDSARDSRRCESRSGRSDPIRE